MKKFCIRSLVILAAGAAGILGGRGLGHLVHAQAPAVAQDHDPALLKLLAERERPEWARKALIRQFYEVKANRLAGKPSPGVDLLHNVQTDAASVAGTIHVAGNLTEDGDPVAADVFVAILDAGDGSPIVAADKVGEFACDPGGSANSFYAFHYPLPPGNYRVRSWVSRRGVPMPRGMAKDLFSWLAGIDHEVGLMMSAMENAIAIHH